VRIPVSIQEKLKLDYLLNEHKARYDKWILLVIFVPLIILLGTTLAVVISEEEGAVETLITFVILAGIIWIIMPRKYLVMSNRLKIVLGASIPFNVPYNNIKELKKPEGILFGINWATSTKTLIQIVLKKGLNINISPDNRESFIQNINKAMQEWRRNNNRND